MKTILVTGGAGFIGSHTVVELHNAGFKPVIIDNFSNSMPFIIDRISEIIGESVTFYEGDYQDTALLSSIIETENIDGVIHFAANKAVGESVANPLKYYTNNVAGFVSLMQCLEEQSVNSIVFSSSCTIYGEPDSLPITEESPVKPATSPYGASKQMDEIIVRDITAASSHLRSMALRYFNPIGSHPSTLIGELPLGVPENLVPFLTQTVAGHRNSLTVYGDDYDTPDGSCIRDYIHVVDLAKAHVLALAHMEEQEAGYNNAVNLGTGRGNSVLEVINTFEQATGKTVPFTIGKRRAGDIVSTYASIEKANDLLGWKPEKSLADALSDAWKWQQKLDTEGLPQ